MNKETQKVLFSSENESWGTPHDLFNGLNKVYNFNLDPAATKENTKCEFYMTENGLEKDWSQFKRVFVNPPYSRSKTPKWVKKGFEEGLKDDTTVVMLLPARTSTKWYHSYCMKAEKIFFIKGRLRFSGAKHCAPFPSMVVVFSGQHEMPVIHSMSVRGDIL